MHELETIGFDADDTLWHHERFYQLTQQRFAELLRPYADPHHLAEHLLAAERRNVPHYGFGVKGFTLSMIETAVEITDGKVPGQVIAQIIEAGRDMLRHSATLFDDIQAEWADTIGATRLDRLHADLARLVGDRAFQVDGLSGLTD